MRRSPCLSRATACVSSATGSGTAGTGRAKVGVRGGGGGRAPGPPAGRVGAGAAGATARVPIDAPAGKRVLIAKEVFVGWTKTAPPVHLRVRFEKILVRRAMDPGCPPTNQ